MASIENEQEENNRQFSLDEVLKKWNISDDEGTDEAASPDKSEGVSMFCKSCLNPYSGEPKSGTIVLKCERCGQTDVVLEEKAVDLDPEEWSGNLMMNRFLQVLKEQEDLQLNIVDPFFADDDFQNLTLAMQEYTFNMKAMAEKMYVIAREARLELEAEEANMANDSQMEVVIEKANDNEMSATTRQKLKRLGATVIKLMESIIKKYNLPSDIMDKVEERIRHPSGGSTNEEEGPTEKTDKETDTVEDSHSDKGDQTEDIGSGANNEEGHAEKTDTETDTLRDSNSDTGDQTEDIDNSENSSKTVVTNAVTQSDNDTQTDKSDNTQPSTDNNSRETPSMGSDNNIDGNSISKVTLEESSDGSKGFDIGQHSVEKHNQGTMDGQNTAAVGNVDDEQVSETQELGVGSVDKGVDKVVDDMQGSLDDTDKDSIDDIEDWDNDDDEPTPGMMLVKEKIKHEIFDVLKEKFALRFESDKDGDTTSSAENKDTITEDAQQDNDAEDNSDNDKSSAETTGDSNNLSSQLFDEIELDEPTEKEEALQVNFYSISSAFINELQSRKREALVERKDKALSIVHQKIVALKAEVERVENRVHEELTSAYRKKLRKVENQRKQLDKRHEAIQDVEELLNHYARTGQHDKLAELMEQLDIQYEN